MKSKNLVELKKAMTNLNEELLSDDPETQAVEADGDLQYEPDPESNIVVTEPKIIQVGRGRRKNALRKLSQEQT